MEPTLKTSVEAVLFSIGDAIEIDKIAESLNKSRDEVENVLLELQREYADRNSGIRILRFDNSFQMSSNPDCYDAIRSVTQAKRRAGLSTSALETLSIIAYNQPITKSAVDFIRGVDSSYSITRLSERELIEEVGRAETPGRPILYATTIEFLRSFGLSSLEELPSLPEKEIQEVEE